MSIIFFSFRFFLVCSDSSWISWPLAFLFNSTDDGGNTTLRFRHLDVRMGSSRRNSATGGNSSPSPEGENGILKSPKKSPQMMRKRGTSPSVRTSNGTS